MLIVNLTKTVVCWICNQDDGSCLPNWPPWLMAVVWRIRDPDDGSCLPNPRTPDASCCLPKLQPRMTAVVCQNRNPGWRQLFAKSPSWITAKCSQSCSRKLFLRLYFLQDWNSQLPYRAVMGMLYEQKNKAVVFLICINIYFRNYKRWTFTMAHFMIGTYKTECWITWIKFFVVG